MIIDEKKTTIENEANRGSSEKRGLSVQAWTSTPPAEFQAAWQNFVEAAGYRAMHCDLRWLQTLRSAFGYPIYALAALQGDRQIVGVLPLALVKSVLFGRFLVGLPSVSWAGAVAMDNEISNQLIDSAVILADKLKVRHLELRHESELKHPALTQQVTNKVTMRLELAESSEEVWKGLKSVVRTQVRKGTTQGFSIEWGGRELLPYFYSIYSHNMRDLGTPVFGQSLFRAVLKHFSGQSEVCVVRLEGKAVASAITMHDRKLTEVPWVSTLAEYRATAVNSWMYWQLIERAVARGDHIFDFGRSTIDSGTYNFKRKWGAEPSPLVWQYYVRKGCATDMRPETGKYGRLISIWRRLPVAVTRIIGPPIVRGIPS